MEEGIANAFAAFGMVPEKEGRRTVAEHRAMMVNVEGDDDVAGAVERVGARVDERLLRVVRPESAGFGVDPPRVVAEEEGGVAARVWRALRGGEVHVPPRRVLAWHWAELKLAVVMAAGRGVQAYDVQRGGLERPRLDPRVRAVRCLQWRPCARDTLAVGCDAGVAIWNGDQCVLWTEAGHAPVVALAWSCDGAKLCTAALGDEAVRIWDPATGVSAPVGLGGVLAFSAARAELMLVGAMRRCAFRLWDVDSWDVQRWGFLDAPPTAVAWNRARVAVAAGEALHVLAVGDRTEVVHCEPTARAAVGPGGVVRALAWDPTGNRIAVAHWNDDWGADAKRRNVVALYAVADDPFQVTPVGFVAGPEGAGAPVDVAFVDRPPKGVGAVLATAWQSGVVSFAQLLFR